LYPYRKRAGPALLQNESSEELGRAFGILDNEEGRRKRLVGSDTDCCSKYVLCELHSIS
jgi:hypothetical protein